MCWKINCFFLWETIQTNNKNNLFFKSCDVSTYFGISGVLHPGFRVGEPIYTAGGEVVGGGLIHGQLA